MMTEGAVIAVEARVTDAQRSAFLADCLAGLRRPQKSIPCKWLYDAQGSKLFERICATPEYYPSRTEIDLLKRAAPAIADRLGPDTALVEFGSGASRKTRLLLDALDPVTSYLPIDISEAELTAAAAVISRDYPWLEVFPILGDFTRSIDLGAAQMFAGRLGFFAGSTLGNFEPVEAIAFLRRARQMLGIGSTLLLGVDLRKDVDTLLCAYDDSAGVTAAFNLNLLARANRELHADFAIDAFRHRATWNKSDSRIEMHLESLCAQHVTVAEERFGFAAGETIHTENSHKFGIDALSDIVRQSGWLMDEQWISEKPEFALILLRA